MASNAENGSIRWRHYVGPISLSEKTSCRKISLSLEAAFGSSNHGIALKFDRHVGSNVAGAPVKFWKRSYNCKYKSRVFEILWDHTIRRLIGYWNKPCAPDPKRLCRSHLGDVEYISWFTSRFMACYLLLCPWEIYRKISYISRTNSQNLNDCRLVLQLPLANPLQPGVKLRIKM